MALKALSGLSAEVRYRLSAAVVEQPGVSPNSHISRYAGSRRDGDEEILVRRDDLAALLEAALGERP